MPRSIVHLDADAFFASVEQAADPRLRGKAMAVGGEKRGIIASASYEARKFGVYTPMPTTRARKLCPKLIVLPGDFEKYERFSRWMFSYAYDFTPDVEISSIDEGYFDLSGARKSPVEIADTIRRAIGQSLKISVSEGIASNKLVSQIASKLHKPAAFAEVPGGREKPFLYPLPNHWLPGVGPKTAAKLNAAGLARIGQIAATPLDFLQLLLGGQALLTREFANGIDERPLAPVRDPAKSYSKQETFAADLTDEEYIEALLRRMADQLLAAVRADHKSIRTITVKVRYNDMAEDQTSESLLEPTDLETDLYSRLRPLLRQAWRRRVSLRMVSLKCSNVYEGIFRAELPLDPGAQRHEARRRLANIIDELRKTHGPRVILRGHDFTLSTQNSGARVGEQTDDLNRSLDRGAPPPNHSRLDPPSLTRHNAADGIPSPGGEGQGEGDSYFPTLHAPHAPHAPRFSGGGEDRMRAISADLWPLTSGLWPPGGEGRVRAIPASLDVKTAGRSARPTPRPAPVYVPLHVHSYYSFLDSTLSIENIVQLARQYELPTVVLTDTGNLHGAVEFFLAARRAGIKPILGVEIEMAGGSLRLLAQNATGYHNLCCILSRAERGEREERGAWSVERGEAGIALTLPSPPGEGRGAGGVGVGGSRNRPHLSPLRQEARGQRPEARGQEDECDNQRIEGFTEGLLAISANPHFASLFPGRFYLEINGVDALRRGSASSDLPQVAALPIHYGQPSDRWKYDVVQSIRTRTLLRQEHPAKRLGGDFHFCSRVEMRDLFGEHPNLLSNTIEIAERCSFDLPLGKPQFPAFTPPDGSTPHDFLRKLVLEGLSRRYPGRSARIQPQIEAELSIIGAVGYEEYFLVVWDLLQTCHQRGIEWITRGSAADSLVCYCLGISDVCPIRFDLYFRRFLNPERMKLNKLPDIDLDFAHDRKDDVIDLIFKKYGSEYAAVVGGFSTFQARSAVGDVAKVLGVSEYQVRRFTERFPYGGASGIEERVTQSQECRDLPLEEEPYRTAMQMAEFLDGFPRYPKMHPCGVVLSRQPMRDLTPTFVSNKGYPTTHYDMDAVEAIGLVKIDILAQGGLAVMRDVGQSLTSRGIEIDLRGLEPWTDPGVWEMIASGGARAVHHIESPAMVGLCRQCNVREIDGLIAIVSVIRPGAANEHKKQRFVRRYQGLEPPVYPHPSLEPCLKSTFGLVVYEEHILQMCELFAGLPAGRADILRRALGKEKQTIIDEIKQEFIAAARLRGRPEEKIIEVWELIASFAGYAFCKAHSTAYGVEAYQSAWLKHYYPAEFMAAVLSNGKGFYHPLVYVLECHRLGIPLLPPWVNEPGPGFALKPPAIRVPVTRVKGMTSQTIDRLLRERSRGEFLSLRDFYGRIAPSAEEMEALVRVGAFDGFGKTRTAQFWEYQLLCQAYGSSAEPGQGWLLPSPGTDRLPEVPLEEPARRERLEWEAELLGFPASGHPLELHDDIAWDTYCPVSKLGEHIGETVVTCGLVIEQRIHHQVTGETMKFLTLADWTGIVETELFASTYRSYGLATVRYPVLEVTATVEPYENQRGYSLRIHRAGKPRTKA